jgi:hypothetical protein
MKVIFKSIDKRFGELNKAYEFNKLRECFNSLCKIIECKNHYQTNKLYVEIIPTEINVSYTVWLEDYRTHKKTPIGFITIEETEFNISENRV